MLDTHDIRVFREVVADISGPRERGRGVNSTLFIEDSFTPIIVSTCVCHKVLPLDLQTHGCKLHLPTYPTKEPSIHILSLANLALLLLSKKCR